MKTQLSILLAEKPKTIFSVSPKSTVKDAANMMIDHHIRSVLVLDDGTLVGLFTERDVLMRVVMGDLDPATTLVEAVMTKDLATVSPTTLVHEALSLISKTHGGHLPVLKDGKPIGVISIGDLARYISHSFENEAGSLWNYITGDDPKAVLDFHEDAT